MRHLLFAAAPAMLFTSLTAKASTITETYAFNLTGFVDIGGNLPPPNPTVTGSFTVTFDPALTYNNDTTDLTVNYLTGVTVGSPLGFTYQGGYFEFGGIQNNADLVFSNTNDLVVALNVMNPSSPMFIPCSTPGYTCGTYTGSSAVDAAGYTTLGTNTGWFYGVQSTVAPAPMAATPEPSSLLLLGSGLLGVVGIAKRRIT